MTSAAGENVGSITVSTSNGGYSDPPYNNVIASAAGENVGSITVSTHIAITASTSLAANELNTFYIMNGLNIDPDGFLTSQQISTALMSRSFNER